MCLVRICLNWATLARLANRPVPSANTDEPTNGGYTNGTFPTVTLSTVCFKSSCPTSITIMFCQNWSKSILCPLCSYCRSFTGRVGRGLWLLWWRLMRDSGSKRRSLSLMLRRRLAVKPLPALFVPSFYPQTKSVGSGWCFVSKLDTMVQLGYTSYLSYWSVQSAFSLRATFVIWIADGIRHISPKIQATS